MNKTISFTLAFIAVLIVIASWFLFSTPHVKAPTLSEGAATSSQDSNTLETSVVNNTTTTVQYTANGFSPASVTIKKGVTVTFTSVNGSPIWVASNEHPTHTGYDGTSRGEHCPDPSGLAFDQCAPGVTYSFTFLKAGTWGYHNHMSPNSMGTVTVVE